MQKFIAFVLGAYHILCPMHESHHSFFSYTSCVLVFLCTCSICRSSHSESGLDFPLYQSQVIVFFGFCDRVTLFQVVHQQKTEVITLPGDQSPLAGRDVLQSYPWLRISEEISQDLSQ